MRRWSKFQEDFMNGLTRGSDVYSNAYFVRIETSLAEDFKSFLDQMDHDSWLSLVRQFTDTLPSEYWTLAEVSDCFLNFLEKRKELPPRWLTNARQDFAITKSGLMHRPEYSFELDLLAQSELILNPTLIPSGNPNEWARECASGITELIVLTPECSELLEALIPIRPLTVDSILEKMPQFSVSSLEKFFHDWVKDEIFIGTQLLEGKS